MVRAASAVPDCAPRVVIGCAGRFLALIGLSLIKERVIAATRCRVLVGAV